MTSGDQILKEVMNAVEAEKPPERFGVYLESFKGYIHLNERILFNDIKLIVPAALNFLFHSFTSDRTRPVGDETFGGKHLVAPFISVNLSSGKDLWTVHKIQWERQKCKKTPELPELSEANEEKNLDFPSPLDENWGTSKHIYFVAKVVNSTSVSSIRTVLTDYCNLYGFP